MLPSKYQSSPIATGEPVNDGIRALAFSASNKSCFVEKSRNAIALRRVTDEAITTSGIGDSITLRQSRIFCLTMTSSKMYSSDATGLDEKNRERSMKFRLLMFS